MRLRKYYIGLGIMLLMLTIITSYNYIEVEAVKNGYLEAVVLDKWDVVIANQVNQSPITIEIDGKPLSKEKGDAYLSQSGEVMIPVEVLREGMRCAVGLYDQNRLLVEKNTKKFELYLQYPSVELSGEDGSVLCPLVMRDGILYVAASIVAQQLEYEFEWNQQEKCIRFKNQNPSLASLPIQYDQRQVGRSPNITDQGSENKCWAYAACETLEASLLPGEHIIFSEDHMAEHNSFHRTIEEGGDYSMAMAYLLAWQGPAQKGNETVPVKHVQEIQLIPKKDLEKIKEAVYIYGGVQSSIYLGMTNEMSESIHYNSATKSYCYIGTEKPNHDIVIVGWDDEYPKEKFHTPLQGNGAFLCQNSWGNEFGEGGYFWISYYDSNIGINNVAYTRVEPTTNYAGIYQSDLCGMLATAGFEREEAYFANIFTARQNERLSAAGFYAVGGNTEYEIYAVPEFNGVESLALEWKVADGVLPNAGYYTIDFDHIVEVAEENRFAVIVKVKTPGNEYPIAVESLANNEFAHYVDISDGESYISAFAEEWKNTEQHYQSNVCLKVYTQ
ncbi:MAG: lectin like domain-containing protein [Candidatus Fimimorpha sp.]